MDDIVIEESMTFVARELGPMTATKTDFVTPSDNFRPEIVSL